ncbi:MAG: hypothetical protein ACI4QM_01655 [Alphaproteobacteria bacterium]
MDRVFRLDEVLTVTTGFNFSSRNSAVSVIESCLPAARTETQIQLECVQKALCRAFPELSGFSHMIKEDLKKQKVDLNSYVEKNQYLLKKVQEYADKTGIDLSFAEYRLSPDKVQIELVISQAKYDFQRHDFFSRQIFFARQECYLGR